MLQGAPLPPPDIQLLHAIDSDALLAHPGPAADNLELGDIGLPDDVAAMQRSSHLAQGCVGELEERFGGPSCLDSSSHHICIPAAVRLDSHYSV